MIIVGVAAVNIMRVEKIKRKPERTPKAKQMKCLHPVNKLIERPTVADFIIISLRLYILWSQIEKPPLGVRVMPNL